MSALIVAQHIKKSFHDQVVLNDLSYRQQAGEFVAVMGTSGSGKSTLLYALSGMDPVDSGEITFDGHVLTHQSEKILAKIRREEMGFVFQSPTLLSNLNIIDNIIFLQLLAKKQSLEMIKTQAIQLMTQVGIGEIKDHEITAASGGQLQRASICRALMNRPKMLFADEPTGALNSKWSSEIMTLFHQINQNGTTIFLVTHDPDVAAHAQRVIFLKDGQIVAEIQHTINADQVRTILAQLEI